MQPETLQPLASKDAGIQTVIGKARQQFHLRPSGTNSSTGAPGRAWRCSHCCTPLEYDKETAHYTSQLCGLTKDQYLQVLQAKNASLQVKGVLSAEQHCMLGGHRETAQLLLSHGANMKALDEHGCTALHLACEYEMGPRHRCYMTKDHQRSTEQTREDATGSYFQ